MAGTRLGDHGAHGNVFYVPALLEAIRRTRKLKWRQLTNNESKGESCGDGIPRSKTRIPPTIDADLERAEFFVLLFKYWQLAYCYNNQYCHFGEAVIDIIDPEVYAFQFEIYTCA